MDQESLAPKPVLALAPAAHDAPPLSVQSDGAWTLATGPPSTPSADALSQLSELREAARLANSRLREALRSTYGMVPSEAGEEAPPALPAPPAAEEPEDHALATGKRLLLLTFLVLLLVPLPGRTALLARTHARSHGALGLPPALDLSAYEPFYAEPPADARHCVGGAAAWPAANASSATGRRYVANPMGPGYGIGNQLFALSAALAYGLAYDRCVTLPSTYFHPSTRSSRSYRDTVFRHFWLQPQLWDAMEGSVKVFDYDGAYTWQPGLSMHYGPFEEPAVVLKGQAKDFWMVVLRGGYQHYNYTWAHRALLQGYLRPSPADTRALLAKYPDLPRGVAVHFRRGDFVALENLPEASKRDFPIPGTFFYSQSADLLTREVEGEGGGGGGGGGARAATSLVFFIFTNDYPWARNQSWVQALPGRLVYVDEEDEVYSFYMMLLAREGIICANSTFCWWAAYLGVSKRQYLPNHWYNSPGHEPTGIHYPGTTVVHSDNEGGEGPPPWYPRPGSRALAPNASADAGADVGAAALAASLLWPAF